MNKRYNKRLNREISEIGFGAWQLGGTGTWSIMSKEEGITLVQEAIANGVNFFDTAPNYADGNSELILGEALQGRREEVIINTKVGHGPNESWEFSPEGIRKSVLRSIKKLQTTFLDSVILHNPEHWVLEGQNDLFKELQSLKEEGLIKLYGVSIDSLDELQTILNSGVDIDTIEIMFNMIHQEPKYLFNEVQERGILLITKVPLDSGWLTGKYSKESIFTDIRSRWSIEEKELRSKIVDDLKEIIGNEASLLHAALQYILHFDAVSVIIPGTKNTSQLNSNIEASNNCLSDEVVEKINEYYEKNLKDIIIPW